MTEVIMPKMGDGMEEGTLLEWLKKDGESVKSGEIIGTIQTDKATLELESPGSGVLTGFLIKEGDTVPVGKAIAAILKDGESLPSGWAGGTASQTPSPQPPPPPGTNIRQGEGESAPPPRPLPATQDIRGEGEPEPLTPQPPLPAVHRGEGESERIKASPLAKKIAAEKGIDLTTIQGSGPGGRIVEKDLASAPAGSAGVSPATRSAGILPADEADSTVKLNKIRQITAQKTQHSKQTVPHFYVTVEVEIDKLQVLRGMFEEEASGKASVNDFVIKACALALREMPIVNSSFQDATTLLQHGAIHIGMAVALEEGLTLPVIHNADQLGIREIGAKSKELAFKARDNKLSMDELTGSTFSISNMGMLNVENFGAIIVEPNAAIVAVGTAKKKLRLNDDDEAEIRMVMKITGSFDHRVVDGAVGARFMNLIREYLENPTRLLS